MNLFKGLFIYMKRGLIARVLNALLIGVGLSVGLFGAPTVYASSGLAAGDVVAEVRALNEPVDKAIALTKANNLTDAAKALDEFHAGWEKVEDAVKAASPAAYAAIEEPYYAAKAALKAGDASASVAALQQLALANNAFAIGPNVSTAPGVPVANAPATTTLATFLTELRELEDYAKASNTAKVTAVFAEVRALWPEIEGDVKTRSAAAYEQSEERLAMLATALRANKISEVATVAEQMRVDLTALTVAPTRYGIFDAAAILLREGLEALLVVAAILAFLVKSGNADKRGWIYGGALVGIVVSIVAAAVITAVSRTAFSGSNREMMEGIISLVAAIMLFYVSYWMHGKAQASAWQKYVRERTTQALASGSLFSLALLSFLSVFREGAETTLFYIGIMQSISMSDLLVGLVIATAALTLIGVLILRFGVRLPLRPFFLVASLLVFYLGFKFVGTGIHALQVAGTLPANIASFLPSIEFIGVFPTWETTIPQIILIAIAVLIVIWTQRPAKNTATPA